MRVARTLTHAQLTHAQYAAPVLGNHHLDDCCALSPRVAHVRRNHDASIMIIAMTAMINRMTLCSLASTVYVFRSTCVCSAYVRLADFVQHEFMIRCVTISFHSNPNNATSANGNHDVCGLVFVRVLRLSCVSFRREQYSITVEPLCPPAKAHDCSPYLVHAGFERIMRYEARARPFFCLFENLFHYYEEKKPLTRIQAKPKVFPHTNCK